MTTAALWVEITIAGFFYLLAVFFVALKVLKVNDLSFFSSFKDYLAFISVVATAIAYLLGILAHRLIPALLGHPIRLIAQRLGFSGLVGARGTQDTNSILFVRVKQYGSERLNREMDFQFSTLALFRSLIVAIPLVGVSSALWLNDTIAKQLTLPVLIASLILDICFFIAYRRQLDHFIQLRDTVFREVRKKRSDMR